MSSGWLPDYDIVDTGRYSNYAGQDYYPYKPIILLHMTVGMGLSRSYVASHTVPPHLWYNVYNGDRFQTAPLDMAARALYQPQYGYHWTNKHDYLLQTELVGVPVVNQETYSDEQCRLIAEHVVVPQVRWLAERGLTVDLNQVRYHTDSSGSASEYWHGRLSEEDLANFNGLLAHIDVWGNDHWDCSVERLDLIAQYAREILGGTTPPVHIPRRVRGMQKGEYRLDDAGNKVVFTDTHLGTCHAIDFDIVHPNGVITHRPLKQDASGRNCKVFFGSHREINASWWGQVGTFVLPGNLPPNMATVVVPADTRYSATYTPPLT